MLIGYTRVSTDDQHQYLQRDALQKAECEIVFEDTASGGAIRADTSPAVGASGQEPTEATHALAHA